jgi:micrococcal nuclease
MKQWVYPATVKRIIDGDSIVITMDLGYGLTKENVKFRLLHINTPEVRGPEKELGVVAKGYLETIMPVDTEILIHSQKLDAFGRVLGDVWIKDQYDQTISEILIETGHALPWDGKGKKPKFNLEGPFPLVF